MGILGILACSSVHFFDFQKPALGQMLSPRTALRKRTKELYQKRPDLLKSCSSCIRSSKISWHQVCALVV